MTTSIELEKCDLHFDIIGEFSETTYYLIHHLFPTSVNTFFTFLQCEKPNKVILEKAFECQHIALLARRKLSALKPLSCRSCGYRKYV